MIEEDRVCVCVHLAAELDHSLSDSAVSHTIGSESIMVWTKEPSLGLDRISWEESSFTVG